MGLITSADQLYAGMINPIAFNKASVGSAVAGQLQSLWTAAGYPVAGATPATGSGAACTAATQGALYLPTPGTGQSLYLAGIDAQFATVGNLLIFDRLVATSGLSGTPVTAQTINTAALPRYTDGAGVDAYLEFYGAPGSTTSTATVSYTNQAGVSPRTSLATTSIASAGVGRLIRIFPQAGDTGFRSIQTLTLVGSNATSGNFGITLVKRIASIPCIIANSGVILDALAIKLPLLQAASTDSSPCLQFAVFASTTSTGFIQGSYNLAVV